MTLVTVTTAISLTDKLREQVKKVAQQKLGHQDFELREELDPSVIGGVKLSMSGQVFDATIANKLKQIGQG